MKKPHEHEHSTVSLAKLPGVYVCRDVLHSYDRDSVSRVHLQIPTIG